MTINFFTDRIGFTVLKFGLVGGTAPAKSNGLSSLAVAGAVLFQ